MKVKVLRRNDDVRIHVGVEGRMTAMMRKIVAAGALALLAGCMQPFSTSYDKAVDPAVSANWHVAAVQVTVPDSLTVSESNELVPDADIVWQEDPPGDRRAQVAAIMKQAVGAGAAGLKGKEAVNILVSVQRFHALTHSAEALDIDNVGVLNVDFTITVADAKTGAVLAGPAPILAALPGLTGNSAIAAHERGETQKKQIVAHVSGVVAGWLGIGPDVRRTFWRIGA